MEIRVGPPTVTIHSDDEFMVCEQNGEMSSELEQGYFAADTRFASGYRLKLGRRPPTICNASAIAAHSARFEFTNPPILDANGNQIRGRCLHLRLDRSVGHGLHEDYDLTNFSRDEIEVDLEISVESDFADLFDVKDHRVIRRGTLQSAWDESAGRLDTTYVNGEFRRGLTLQVENADSSAEYANGGILFRIAMAPGQQWHTCVLWQHHLGESSPRLPTMPCHNMLGTTERDSKRDRWMAQVTGYETADPVLTATIRQAVEDLAAMRLHRHDDIAKSEPSGDDDEDVQSWVPAAGIPWFVTLFGRDSLVVSLQTLSLSPRFALGSLRALARLQATDYDDDRDMQPGKIQHEIRHGELAALKLVPQTPYYGTHEASMLYVLLAAEAWRWHGDRTELDLLVPHVERALAWIDTDGDLDGDGLQEYRPRGPRGYYNQGWKDSGDAIVGADGNLAKLPIALCEHQGAAARAKRAWADVLESVYGDRRRAVRLRSDADRLAGAIEERFWWDQEGTYYLGLDGDKRPIESVASNPGHLLWQQVVTPERARLVARRLLAPDMWSGWGIRTLSSGHAAYNPFSYQLGSVWPHDNALAAAGFRAYGLDAEAARVSRGIFDTAARFESLRLPELFAGLTRDSAGFPVQYLGANVPQAWASGAVIHLIAVLLGLRADAAAHVLHLRPALPEWMREIRLEHLAVGDATADLLLKRRDDGTHELSVEQLRGRLDITIDAD